MAARFKSRLSRIIAWAGFCSLVVAFGVSAQPSISGETVIKGYRALMSPAEFDEVSASHLPKAHPKPNTYEFVDCGGDRGRRDHMSLVI